MWPYRNKAQQIRYRLTDSHHLEYQLRFVNGSARNGARERGILVLHIINDIRKLDSRSIKHF